MSESLKKLIDAHILNLQLEKKADQQEIKELKAKLAQIRQIYKDFINLDILHSQFLMKLEEVLDHE